MSSKRNKASSRPRTAPTALSNSWSHTAPSFYHASHQNMSPPHAHYLSGSSGIGSIGVPLSSYQSNFPQTSPERRRRSRNQQSPTNLSSPTDSKSSDGGQDDDQEDTFEMDL